MSQKCCQREETKFFEKKNSYGYPQPKVGKSQEISGMGCKKIF